MTLETLLTNIANVAINETIVHWAGAGADIYRLNGMTVKDYPAVFASPTGTHTAGENTTRYTITLYFLDRLLEDSSNDVTIMSTAIECLKNTVKAIEGIKGVVDVSTEYELENYIETEAFNDRLAGAWTTITVEVMNDTTCVQG